MRSSRRLRLHCDLGLDRRAPQELTARSALPPPKEAERRVVPREGDADQLPGLQPDACRPGPGTPSLVSAVIRHHHERFDGMGYPDGLAGRSIPWTARCLAVAVGFVESGQRKQAASDAILAQAGTAYDPEALAATPQDHPDDQPAAPGPRDPARRAGNRHGARDRDLQPPRAAPGRRRPDPRARHHRQDSQPQRDHPDQPAPARLLLIQPCPAAHRHPPSPRFLRSASSSAWATWPCPTTRRRS